MCRRLIILRDGQHGQHVDTAEGRLVLSPRNAPDEMANLAVYRKKQNESNKEQNKSSH